MLDDEPMDEPTAKKSRIGDLSEPFSELQPDKLQCVPLEDVSMGSLGDA